jgi:hypothetical protein
MSDIVSFNIFSGNLINTPGAKTVSVPLEIFTNDDSEFIPAIYAMEYNQAVYKFTQGALHTIRGRFKVPSDYSLGLMQLSIAAYSPSIVNTFKFNVRSFLYLPTTGIIGSETLYNDADSGVITNAGVAETYQKLTINLTDGNSKIGGTLVAAGALIDFRLQRSTLVSNDDAADIRIVSSIEVILQ